MGCLPTLLLRLLQQLLLLRAAGGYIDEEGEGEEEWEDDGDLEEYEMVEGEHSGRHETMEGQAMAALGHYASGDAEADGREDEPAELRGGRPSCGRAGQS